MKGTKYLWLWSQENIPFWRQEEFELLRSKDLKVCRAWAIKENLRHMWDYRYAAHMRNYFKRWYFWATHSRLEPVKKAAKTLKGSSGQYRHLCTSPDHQCSGRGYKRKDRKNQKDGLRISQSFPLPHGHLFSLRRAESFPQSTDSTHSLFQNGLTTRCCIDPLKCLMRQRKKY